MSLTIIDPWTLLYEPFMIHYKYYRVQESVYLQFYTTLTLPTIVQLPRGDARGLSREYVLRIPSVS